MYGDGTITQLQFVVIEPNTKLWEEVIGEEQVMGTARGGQWGQQGVGSGDSKGWAVGTARGGQWGQQGVGSGDSTNFQPNCYNYFWCFFLSGDLDILKTVTRDPQFSTPLKNGRAESLGAQAKFMLMLQKVIAPPTTGQLLCHQLQRIASWLSFANAK